MENNLKNKNFEKMFLPNYLKNIRIHLFKPFEKFFNGFWHLSGNIQNTISGTLYLSNNLECENIRTLSLSSNF